MPRPRRRRRARTTLEAAPPTKAAPARTGPWRPTVALLFAFFLGLWLGGTLGVNDTTGAIALLVGAVGVGLTGARLLRERIRARRIEQARADRSDHSAAP